jgi:hypothetical protein
MRELNPVGREDDLLLLTSEDGERFTVVVDETLMRTLKEHRVPDQSGVELSPRQIQDAIRSGETITSLAERSGGSLDLIERFAHPVLEELKHMIELAQAVRIELPADRFNDVVKKEFGEIVADKLRASGVKNVRWASKRGENTLWEISVHYTQNDAEGSATWSFDPKKYLLTPETANASALSNPSSAIDGPLAYRPSPSVPNEEAEATVVTADKLQAFRLRREQQTGNIEVVDAEIEIEEQAPVEPVVPDEDLSVSKKTRAPMPSWDQIVRGTQSEDDDAF